MILEKELYLIKLKIIYLILKMNINFMMNLILKKVNNQEKDLLEQLKNVKVNLIINIMQLN